MNDKATSVDLYEYEIGRFQDLLKENQNYAFNRYGLTLFYSLPTEQTFQMLADMGWKGKDPLDYYNLGAIDCQEGRLKEAMKNFEKAESMGCDQPELFYNIAAIHEENGDITRAKEYYQKYVDSVEKYEHIPKDLEEELDEVREHLKSL